MMASGALATVLLAAVTACASGGTPAASPPPATTTPAPTPTPDTATVDAALDKGFRAMGQLLNLDSEDLAETAGQYRLAQSDLDAAAGLLTPSPAGVPEATARTAVSALTTLSDSLGTTLECIAASPGTCDVIIDAMRERSGDLGSALAALVPYSARSLGYWRDLVEGL